MEGEDDHHIGEWLDAVRHRFQESGDVLTGADWNPHSFNPFKTDFSGRAGYALLTLQIGSLGAALVQDGR